MLHCRHPGCRGEAGGFSRGARGGKEKGAEIRSVEQTPDISEGTHRAPEQPQGLQVLPEGPYSILVTWTKSSGADHYNVYVEGEDMEDTTTSTYYVWYNLKPCTNYTFGVTAVSAEGDMSEPALGEGQTEVGPAPAPQNLQVDSYTSMTVTLTWGKPDTLCDIEHYTVKYSKEGGSQTQDAQVSGTTFTVTNLLPDTVYTFEVYAATSYGGGPAASVQQTTAADEGGPPEDLVAEGVSPSAINVSWSAPPYTKPQYYLVQAPPCSYSYEKVYGLQYLITGLYPCQRCYISVTSYYSDSVQYTVQTSAFSVGGAPLPPPEGCSVDVQESSIRVDWERPDTDCVVEVYSVDWTWKTLWGDEEEGSDSVIATGTAEIVYNPVPYSEYSFEICASIYGVFGRPTLCIDTSLETPASAPTDLEQVAETVTSVTVQWSLPELVRGKLIGWHLNWTSAIGAHLGEHDIVDSNERVFEVVNLEPSRGYNVYVMAVNGAGPGEAAVVEASTEYVP